MTTSDELPEDVRLRRFTRERPREPFTPFETLCIGPPEVAAMSGNAASAFQCLGRRRR